MTTNGQVNDTRDYHIKPTNSTCNMISCFCLKGLCVAKIVCQHSPFLIIAEKCKNIKTKYVRQNPCYVESLLQYTFLFTCTYPVYIATLVH